MTATTLEVPTPQGPGRWLLSPSTTDPARALLVVGHGAGGGLDGVDLVALATLLPEAGMSVARFEQPWHVAGRRVAGRPATLDEAWLAGLEGLVAQPQLAALPLVVAGHSAGARVACRTAEQVGARAVVCLSFPLHPPGKPEATRLGELVAPAVPVLVVQGERDPFGSAEEVSSALASGPGASPRRRTDVVEVSGAAHNLAVAARVRSAADHRRYLADRVRDFLEDVLP